MRYLLQLGHSPHIASKEVSRLLTLQGVKFAKTVVDSRFLVVSTKNQFDPVDLLNQSGGIVRIAQLLERVSAKDTVKIKEAFYHRLTRESANGKLTFAITGFDVDLQLHDLAGQLKNRLKADGITARYLVPKHQTLAPVRSRQPVSEFILVRETSNEIISIFQTQVVSDVLDWQKRDRGRPAVDARSGITPPKLARMMINLIRPSWKTGQLTLWDPFCGSGTFLMEGLMTGFQVLGSDISSHALKHARQNLRWLSDYLQRSLSYDLHQLDITDKSAILKFDYSVDLIVSEGYLGPPHFNLAELPRIKSELLDLYQGAIPQTYQILKPAGQMALALPEFTASKNTKFQQKLIDICLESGYTLLSKPLLYSYHNKRVSRRIYILTKT